MALVPVSRNGLNGLGMPPQRDDFARYLFRDCHFRECQIPPHLSVVGGTFGAQVNEVQTKAIDIVKDAESPLKRVMDATNVGCCAVQAQASLRMWCKCLAR